MTHVETAAPDRVLAAVRPLEHVKPSWRGWLHLLWFEVSLVVGTVLVIGTPGHARWPVTAYAGAVCALFGTSALYHRGTWGPRAHRWLQRLDHAMIFVLIAGTATPVFATAVRGVWSDVLLGGMWGLTGLAMIVHLVWMHAPETLVGSTYIALGVLGSAALPAVWIGDGVAPALLVCAGGVMYIVGAVLYHRRKPDPSPEVFGFHEVFHGFVCAGATLHYVAIACLIAR
ncbi:hemolysin III family protein [uncultured Jatrophihabitans sp.]|uniref:PAQR family membrane homeostasis protein TrhA n=1 Tax=uncultured Jatrophihabitans sp. TaxID=1610747 RepID=UPI0035CBF822